MALTWIIINSIKVTNPSKEYLKGFLIYSEILTLEYMEKRLSNLIKNQFQT